MTSNIQKLCKTDDKSVRVAACLALLAPFVNYWFFAICILLGLKYSETDNVSLYSVAAIVLCITCLLIQFKAMVVDRQCYGRSVWLFICLAALIAIDLLFNKNNYQQYNYFSNFVLYGGLGMLAGIYLSGSSKFNNAWTSVDVIIFACTAGSALFELSQYSGSGFESRGYAGLSYQSISYMSAIAYTFSLWSIVCVEPSDNLSLLNNRAFRYIKILLLPIQFLISAISGGRGGIVAIAAATFVVIILKVKWGNVKPGKMICVIAAAVIFFALLVLWSDSLFKFTGFERLLTRGDNRSDVWGIAIEAIGGSPLIGYGLGGYDSVFKWLYPHNLILDITLSAGLLGLAFFLIAFIYLIKKLLAVIRNNFEEGSFLALTGAFSLIYLSVSGTFVSFAPFWFVASALVAYEDSQLFGKTPSITGECHES